MWIVCLGHVFKTEKAVCEDGKPHRRTPWRVLRRDEEGKEKIFKERRKLAAVSSSRKRRSRGRAKPHWNKRR